MSLFRQQRRVWAVLVAILVAAGHARSGADDRVDIGLVGHWKLDGDCRDYSGLGHHAINHGVDLTSGRFDGVGAYLEVASADWLKLGTRDFTVSARIFTDENPSDVVGDVMQLYDPSIRRGFTLSINSGASGYQGQGSDRQIHLGIDNAHLSDWQDCGRPSKTSNYISNSLVVFQGKLYAAVTDAADRADWRHVFRYEGNRQWTDCGQVGTGHSPGVGPLIVHGGDLFAVTWTYDWTRVGRGDYDAGRVYRYRGGTEWEDCGQPSDNRTLNCAASFKGKLYVGGGPETWGVFVQPDGDPWAASKLFPRQGPERCFPHAMSRYNGNLFVAYPAVYAFNGEQWSYAGLPGPLDSTPTLQTHTLAVYQGQLCAGTWPEGKVARYLGGEAWAEIGRVGEDGTEVNDLLVYNGKLYGASIPRAEVCRYDDAPHWTSLRRFYSPDGWQPALPGAATTAQVNQWSRVTSMTIYNGKLFAGIGSCTSSVLDAPNDVRGSVHCIEAGKCTSYDHDLGAGWKHVTAMRAGDRLKLYIDGQLVSSSSTFIPSDYDISTNQPLLIGFGQTDYFCGQMSDVRIYNRSLSDAEVLRLAR